MRASYNQIAGQSVERLAALSDGVFALAMTLLVLDLRAPAEEIAGGAGASVCQPCEDVNIDARLL